VPTAERKAVHAGTAYAWRIDEIVFPPSTDLKQAGLGQPLAVFEREFAIGVQIGYSSRMNGRILSSPAVGSSPGYADMRVLAALFSLLVCAAPVSADPRFDVGLLLGSTRADRTPNPLQRDTNSGAVEFGGGMDVRGFSWLGFRAEIRDVYTGRRHFAIATPGHRVHNVVVSGGPSCVSDC
jgi:hypothetical protein